MVRNILTVILVLSSIFFLVLSQINAAEVRKMAVAADEAVKLAEVNAKRAQNYQIETVSLQEELEACQGTDKQD